MSPSATAAQQKMSRPGALTPFRIRSYRFQWPADLLTSWAFEMETLILGWYVLVETNSVLMLTVFGALLYVGTLIAPLVGVWSDRIGHRNMLSGMRAIYGLVSGALMILAFTGTLGAPIVLVLATVTGIVRPSDMGLRGALIADTMPADTLTAAMGISRTTSDTARIAGALTGTGVSPVISMTPTGTLAAPLTLSTGAGGRTSTTINVTNTGTAPLSLVGAPALQFVNQTVSNPALAVGAPNPLKFTATHNCNNIAAGGKCKITVTFTPGAGTRNQRYAVQLNVLSNASNGTLSAFLRGTRT